MEKITQQEILLITGTRFSSRQCWQKINDSPRLASEADQLQDACWDGLLKEMLPEICTTDKNIFLWQIRQNKCGLEIELGELPSEIDSYYSIDPYIMLEDRLMN